MHPKKPSRSPRALMRLLREGEIAFKEERWSDGITALSALLWSDDNTLPADLRGQDYFVDHGIAGLLNKSVKGGDPLVERTACRRSSYAGATIWRHCPT
ncbi:MAG: hypothetical protein R3C56_24260 [Pirellulaceae bacterium]